MNSVAGQTFKTVSASLQTNVLLPRVQVCLLFWGGTKNEGLFHKCNHKNQIPTNFRECFSQTFRFSAELKNALGSNGVRSDREMTQNVRKAHNFLS